MRYAETENRSAGHRSALTGTFLWRIPARPAYPLRTTQHGSAELARTLERHPELHDVIFREYIQLYTVAGDYGFTQLPAYRAMPLLESEARWNMRKYGLPYDPMRAWSLRSGVDVRAFLEWLAGSAK